MLGRWGDRAGDRPISRTMCRAYLQAEIACFRPGGGQRGRETSGPHRGGRHMSKAPVPDRREGEDGTSHGFRRVHRDRDCGHGRLPRRLRGRRRCRPRQPRRRRCRGALRLDARPGDPAAAPGSPGGEENRDSELVREWFDATGAVVMGRTMYELDEEFWGDDPPFRTRSSCSPTGPGQGGRHHLHLRHRRHPRRPRPGEGRRRGRERRHRGWGEHGAAVPRAGARRRAAAARGARAPRDGGGSSGRGCGSSGRGAPGGGPSRWSGWSNHPSPPT